MHGFTIVDRHVAAVTPLKMQRLLLMEFFAPGFVHVKQHVFIWLISRWKGCLVIGVFWVSKLAFAEGHNILRKQS